MPEVSIIIPVYNAEKFLHKCVDSILKQTFADFELILVDDGSPDGSGAICDAYAAKDSRVRVIHQKNQGQSVARNNAMEQMRGTWVMYVDSDDWMHPRTLELLYNAVQTQGLRISVCGYADTTGEDPRVEPEQLSVELWTPKDFYMRRFINATVCWGKLYHRDCVQSIRFPVGKYIDDEYFTYRLLFGQETLAVISAPLYAYYVNPDSITKRAWNPKRLDAWGAYEEQLAFFEAYGDEELVRFRYRGYLENAMANLHEAEKASASAEITESISYIKKHIRKLIPRAWKRGCMDFWIDYDLLFQFYPLMTRAYRFWIDKVRRG